MVTFVVDAEPVKFMIHRDVACSAPHFFKSAFESQMVEDATRTMRLEDVETEKFGLLVQWISRSD